MQRRNIDQNNVFFQSFTTGVLDMEVQGSQQTVEKVLCFANEMISAIMNHEICSKVSIKKRKECISTKKNDG